MAPDAKGAAYEGTDPSSGCYVKLAWIAANAALVGIAIRICREDRWTLTAKDAAYWIIVGVVVALRYVDVTRISGRTMDGEVATVHGTFRYAIALLGVSAAGWTIAQSIHF